VSSTVTERHTKRDIYAAYESALKEIQDLQSANPDRRRTFEQTKNAKVLKMTTETTPEAIVKDLGDFRLKANEAISSLEDQMIAKKQNLEQIQTAIGLAETELKNVHGITKEADSLAALVNAQSAEKETFNVEMADMRTEWKSEQESNATKASEQERLVEQARKRTAEEYAFNLKVARRNDSDTWDQEKVQRESSVVAREGAMGEKEKQFAELEDSVAGHEAALASAVTEAAEAAKKKADQSNGFETRALKSNHENAAKIAEMQIEVLETKITDLEAANKGLTSQVSVATGQVQTIAKDAIAGAQARIVPVTAEPTGKR